MTEPDATQLSPYVAAGYRLLPLHKWDKKTKDKKGKVTERGKSPIDTDWTNRIYDNQKVVKHAEQGFNVGVRLTAEQLVVDVDPRNMPEGRDTFKEFCDAVGLDLEDYPLVNTGSGGVHVYMRKPSDISVMDSIDGYEGVEFKTRGRQVVAAGSKHPNGKLYTWDIMSPPVAAAPDAPDRLLSLIKRPTVSASSGGEGGEFDQQEIAEMLAALDPEDFQDQNKWLSIMQACHHASNGDARSEFIDWSTSDPKYTDDAWVIGRRWDSLHRQRDGATVTYRTLIMYLNDAGRPDVIPRIDADEDFKDLDGVPGDQNLDDIPEHERKGPLARMNDYYWAVDDAGKFRVMYEVTDPVDNRKTWVSASQQDFGHFLANRKIEKTLPDGDTVTVPLAKAWMEWGDRRSAQGVVFDPERNHPGFLNLWTGWGVDPKPGQWGYLQELIHEVLCDGDDKSTEFVMNWMAYMVQHPGVPPEVAIAFHGDKGTGKSTLGRALVGLAGKHGLQVTSSEHITGRFNSHLMDTLMLFADEAVRPTDHEAQSRLKALVTETYMSYEAKGRDLKRGINRVHVMMASNDDWFVPMGTVDGERRFFVSRVNNKRQRDFAFFEKLHRQLLEEDGLSAMLHDLQLRDIGDWAPRGNEPETLAMTEQKLRNMGPVEQWWFSLLQEGEFDFQTIYPEETWARGSVRAFVSDVKESFISYCERNRIRHSSMNRGIDKFFWAEIRKVVTLSEHRDEVPEERQLEGIRPHSDGRQRSIMFPSCFACRDDFMQAINGPIDWATPLDQGEPTVLDTEEDELLL